MNTKYIGVTLLTGAMALGQHTVNGEQHERHPGQMVITTHTSTEGEAMKMVLSDVTMSRFSVEGKAVKNAPYSAEAVTETTQTLGDGNRISHKNTSSLYRDSQGRTRREDTISTVGPWSTANEPFQTIMVNDPVAGTHYVLDGRSKTARKMTVSFDRNMVSSSTVTMTAPALAAGEAKRFFSEQVSGENTKVESLGQRTIEGLVCDGTRTTVTIPAGKIGNDLAINIVSERWYSPELQLTVLSKNSDPRTGETVYQLTRINRAEPSPSLFQVPAEYTINSDGNQPAVIRLKKAQE